MNPSYGQLCSDGEALGLVQDRGFPVREFFRHQGKLYRVEIGWHSDPATYEVRLMPDARVITTHAARPAVPINVDNRTFCGCDKCVQEREEWAKARPPLAARLNPRDAEDAS